MHVPGQNNTSLALHVHFSMPIARCELWMHFNISTCMLAMWNNNFLMITSKENTLKL